MNTKFFILFTLLSIMVTSTRKNQPQAASSTNIKQNGTKQISAKKQPNHINRKTLQTTQNLIRNVKRHKMVLKEMVVQNNYEIIAQKKSQFLNNTLGNSRGFKMFTKFSQIAALIRQQQISYDLNQTLEETLTKFLTLANRATISTRGKNFYYLYEYKSYKSFIVDLREKKSQIENLCNFGKKKNLIQCTHNLHEAYNQLFLYYNDFDLAVVTSPEFKDRYEEQIDPKYMNRLDKKQIEKMAQQHLKNITIQSEKNLEKLKKLVNDLFHRKINIISNVHESSMVKDKTYDEIIQFLNNKIYIRKSKDVLFNFYSYHFITSIEHLLAPVFSAEKDQNIPGLVGPYRCYVYEKSRVDDAVKDIQALQDFLEQNKDKSFKKFRKNLKNLKNFYMNLDDQHSDNFVLEQLRSHRKNLNNLQAKSGKRSTKNLAIKSGVNRFAQQKKIVSQKISPSLKRTILERIIGFHTKVPKSRLVKRTMYFRKNYEQSKLGNQRSCEKSFFAFLETAADMFIGSEPLDYRGDEIRIYGYIYRNDFYNKLYQKMRLLQDCLKKQSMTKTNEEVKLAYQKVIERYNQIHRLNHDYIELEIQYNINAIRKKINGSGFDLSSSITDDERAKIELYKEHLKKQFYTSKGIQDEPQNQIEPTIAHTERSFDTITQQPLVTPLVNLNQLSSDEDSSEQTIQQRVVHRNRDLSFESESDSLEMSEEQLNIEMQDLNREVQKYQKMNINQQVDSDSSQISNEQLLQLQIEEDVDETSEEEEIHDKPVLDISNLNKSQMYKILLKIKEMDQKMDEWNSYKSYQKSIYFLITAINNINLTVEDNSFNEKKKGTWIVLKFREDYFSQYIAQLKQYTTVLVKFYSIEGDQLKQLIDLLLNYINQEIHSHKGFYYERYFIQGDDGSESEEQDVIDMSKVPNYNDRLKLDKIKASKLHKIILQLLFDVNKKYIDLLKLDKDPSQFENDMDQLIDTLNVLLDDDNLVLKSKFNKKKNRFINYGLFKFSSQSYNDLDQNIQKISNDLGNEDDQISKDLIDDLNDIINFFNKLKQTRAYYYEITNAEFDNNMNFIRYDSDDQDLSLEEDSSESSKKNKSQKNPRAKNYSFQSSSEEDNSAQKKQYSQDDYIDTSNEDEEQRNRTVNRQKKMIGQGEVTISQDSSNEYNYEIDNSNSVITEHESEEDSELLDINKGNMKLDKITNSKLYKPLLNLQNVIIQNRDFILKFNQIVFLFNSIVENDDFEVTTIKKTKNRKALMGTYHYGNDLSNQFLDLIKDLDIYLEEFGGHELLIDDLRLVVNIFPTFISTRQYYHESYLILLDNNDNQISKPLYDFDLESIDSSDFELLDTPESKNGIKNNKKEIKQLSDGVSNTSSDSEDHLNQDSPDRRNNLSMDSEQSDVKITVTPKNLSLEDSSEEDQEINQLNKNKKTVEKNKQPSGQYDQSVVQRLSQEDIISSERNSQVQIHKQIVIKRKIYVIEILECEDCMENEYMERVIE